MCILGSQKGLRDPRIVVRSVKTKQPPVPYHQGLQSPNSQTQHSAQSNLPQIPIFLFFFLNAAPFHLEFAKKKKKNTNVLHPMHGINVLLFSCPVMTLCGLIGCSTPVLPGPHHLPESAQVHVHCIGDALVISSSDVLFSCPQSFPGRERQTTPVYSL